jgi:hypothetical protein
MAVLARSTDHVKELSMMRSGMGSVPAKFPKKTDAIAERGVHGPMAQQGAVGSHGYEMYPQELVQLVGCHDLGAGKHEADCRLH